MGPQHLRLIDAPALTSLDRHRKQQVSALVILFNRCSATMLMFIRLQDAEAVVLQVTGLHTHQVPKSVGNSTTHTERTWNEVEQ